MKVKTCIMSIFLAFVTLATLVSMAHATPQWWFDTQTGNYTEVQVCVAGTFMNGKVYSPAAYVYGVITKNLPSPFFLVIYWYFEWEDINHNIHANTSTTPYPSDTQAGQYERIIATGLPSQVIYIYVEGRVGYDGIWDTPIASVGVPFN